MKDYKRLQKIPKESKNIKKDYKRFQKNPKDFERFYKSPKHSKRFQTILIPKEALLLLASAVRKVIVFWKPPKNQRIRGVGVA